MVGTRSYRVPERRIDDQKRIATPEFAISQGADFIVVGRPIIESENPNEAARGIFGRCLI